MSLKDHLKRTPAWIYVASLLAAGVVMGLGSHALRGIENPILEGGLVALVVALAMAGSVVYWRRLDEAAREAHKFAWYWGGSAGLGVATIAFALMMGQAGVPVTTGFDGGTRPEDFVALGILGTILAQVTGYAIAWVGWWVSKR